MATVLSELPLHGLALYPWHKWFDGQVWELRHGDDFHRSIESFRSTVNRTAREKGCRCKTRRIGDSVLVIEAVWPDDHAYSIAKRISEQRGE